jgi:hypothetical protein
MRKRTGPMNDLKKKGMRLIPFLPFLIAFLAVLVAAYHIHFYW